MKGLLVVKAALNAAETGKTGDFDKMSQLMNKYLPDTVRFRLKERVRITKKLCEAIKASESDLSEKLNSFIMEELKNLILTDKIILLDYYLKLSNSFFGRATDKDNQIRILKSIEDENISDSDLGKIKSTFRYLIKYFKEQNKPEYLALLEKYYKNIVKTEVNV